jgi:Mrp family chromosome partitioning ATPase
MTGSSMRIARNSGGFVRRRTLPIAVVTALTVIVMVVLDGGSPVATIVEGLLVGIALGVCIAFVWDRYSERLRTVADVEAATGLPVLATIPPIGAGDREPGAVADDGFDEAAQVYRRLAAELAFDLRESGAKSLLVTSPVRRAGRTTTAVNLAARFAADGMTVVLVSADAHGSRVDQRLGLSPRPGLMDVLDGSSTLDAALQASGRARLRVLPAGVPSDRGAVSYSLDDLAQLLDQLAKTVDLAVIEAPPVFGGVETLLLVQEVDLVLLAVDIRHGRRSDASTAVSYLGNIQDKLVGTIANDPGRRSPAVALAPAALRSDLRRGIGAIAMMLGALAARTGRAARSTKDALASVVKRGPLRGRPWARAGAIAAAAAIVIATVWWAAYDDQGGDNNLDASATGALSRQAQIHAALEDCRSHWDAQDALLKTAARSMKQWQLHIDAMNQLVAGEITLRQASAFWEKTRIHAARRAERFFDADSAYTDREYSCRAPAPNWHDDRTAASLPGCRHGIAQREDAIRAARVAIETWHHHVIDMNMLRAGTMSSTRAVQLWSKYWRQGAAEVHHYRVQLRQTHDQHCGPGASSS